MNKLTRTLVNLLSSSFGSGIGCLALGFIVLCLILACRPCNFDEGITLSVSCAEVFSFDNAIPIVTKFQINAHNQKNHCKTQIYSSSLTECATGFYTTNKNDTALHTLTQIENENPPQTLYSRNCCLLFGKSSLQRNYKLKDYFHAHAFNSKSE